MRLREDSLPRQDAAHLRLQGHDGRLPQPRPYSILESNITSYFGPKKELCYEQWMGWCVFFSSTNSHPHTVEPCPGHRAPPGALARKHQNEFAYGLWGVEEKHMVNTICLNKPRVPNPKVR